ncbi:hypothetical protein [Nocardiopsis deserti]|uniref:hypothetical protein n=1 Tax=Nocardiopsis deserti TaxID=2605988 RepID=UPI001CC26F05|nr:hypothetical protein [Nocardiopsis deserti]
MPGVDDDVDLVWSRLSKPRMAPYLDRTGGDRRAALAVYEWSGHTAAAAFEDVGHLEVLLRNTLDRCLRDHYREDTSGIPWFLMPVPGGEYVGEAVGFVRQRLRGNTTRFPAPRETRDQIVAGLTFGFWSGLVGARYEQLWRDCLHRAFPHSSGQRKQVSVALDGVHKFRNRLAHHDSMLNVDIPFEIRRIFEAAGYIDPRVAAWLRRRSRAMRVYRQRPVDTEDTVVVAADDAWPLYQECHAYVCRAGRFFRDVERIAFHSDGEVRAAVPAIVHRRDQVEWTPGSAAQLLASPDGDDRRIAEVIRASRALGWQEGRYQVFLLSRDGDSRHRELSADLPDERAGDGAVLTRDQRYTSLHFLQAAETTADL